MKENSPICARLAETKTAVWSGKRSAVTIRKAPIDFATRMTRRTATTWIGSRTRMVGSKSMPIEKKKRTAKASCSGSESVAALWLSSVPFSTTPARKAPSAIETPKSCAEPTAMPSARASTERVKSSREPTRATWPRIQGTTFGPRRSTTATNAPTLAIV
jgi:hypothetical protein